MDELYNNGTKGSIIRIRTLKAFLLSLLLHLLIFLLFTVSFKELKMPEPQSQSRTIALDIKTFVPPKPKPQPVSKPVPTPPAPLAKPTVQPIKEAKRVKKEENSLKTIPIAEKATIENNTTKVVLNKPKKADTPKKPNNVERKPVQSVAQAKRKTSAQQSKDPLANMLMGSGSRMSPKTNEKSFADKMVDRIYGKEFHTYSKEQKRFIKQNLGEIYRITQNTLWQKGYPDIALRMHMQGTNIVSFYLHPNGDISELSLKSPIGYKALDQNTIEVIKTAYKDYPKPEKKTKIMFYVTYTLY